MVLGISEEQFVLGNMYNLCHNPSFRIRRKAFSLKPLFSKTNFAMVFFYQHCSTCFLLIWFYLQFLDMSALEVALPDPQMLPYVEDFNQPWFPPNTHTPYIPVVPQGQLCIILSSDLFLFHLFLLMFLPSYWLCCELFRGLSIHDRGSTAFSFPVSCYLRTTLWYLYDKNCIGWYMIMKFKQFQ